jgi:hypothetical protein
MRDKQTEAEKLAEEAGDAGGSKGGGLADFLFGSIQDIETLEQVASIPDFVSVASSTIC